MQAFFQGFKIVVVAAAAPIDELGAGVVGGVVVEALDKGPTVASEWGL